MPIYEYECNACGYRSELIRRMADADEPAACDQCGSGDVARVLSVFSANVGAAHQRPGGAPAPSGPTCGACGGPHGSCGARVGG